MQILHISEVDVRETKMMGDSPLIIVGVSTFSSVKKNRKIKKNKVLYYVLSWLTWVVQFQTQQVYCVRDRLGEITEGGKVILLSCFL